MDVFFCKRNWRDIISVSMLDGNYVNDETIYLNFANQSSNVAPEFRGLYACLPG